MTRNLLRRLGLLPPPAVSKEDALNIAERVCRERGLLMCGDGEQFTARIYARRGAWQVMHGRKFVFTQVLVSQTTAEVLFVDRFSHDSGWESRSSVDQRPPQPEA